MLVCTHIIEGAEGGLLKMQVLSSRVWGRVPEPAFLRNSRHCWHGGHSSPSSGLLGGVSAVGARRLLGRLPLPRYKFSTFNGRASSDRSTARCCSWVLLVVCHQNVSFRSFSHEAQENFGASRAPSKCPLAARSHTPVLNSVALCSI